MYNLVDHYLLPEQMEELQDLGLDTNDAKYWWVCPEDSNHLWPLPDGMLNFEGTYEELTYSLPELLEKINVKKKDPDNWGSYELCPIDLKTNTVEFKHYWNDGSRSREETLASFSGPNLIGSAYRMLVWLLNNNYYET